MSLLKLADLIGKLIEGIMILAKKVRIIKEKEKVDEGLEEGDQRKIEDAFGSSSGPSDPNRFPGLFKRPRKKTERKFWLIDYGNLALYRVIDANNEEAIHIKDNKQMKNFMCMDKTEAELLIEEINDAYVW